MKPRRTPGARVHARSFQFLATAALGSVVLTAAANDFAIDTAQSQVTVSGTVSAFGNTIALVPQLNTGDPSSVRLVSSGTLRVERVGDSVQFLAGSRVETAEVGAWQPGRNGADFGPANFALAGDLPIGVFKSLVYFVGHDVVFDLTSAALPLQEGNFSSDLVSVGLPDPAMGSVDHYFVGALTDRGTTPVQGILGSAPGGTGSITVEAGVETLRLPVDGTYAFSVPTYLGPVNVTLRFQGRWVATAPEVVEDRRVQILRSDLPGAELSLVWPPGLKLQRSPSLTPAAWEDVADQPPLSVSPDSSEGYFRAVPQ